MTTPTPTTFTREEWHGLIAAAYDAAVLTPSARPMPPVRWSTGYPPGTRGRGVAHVLPPKASRDGVHWEVYIAPTLARPGADADLAAVTCAIAAAIARGCAIPKPTDAAAWQSARLSAAYGAAEALELVGPYPSDGLAETEERKAQGTRMLKVECSRCGWLCRTTAKHIAALHADSACPACDSRGTLAAC